MKLTNYVRACKTLRLFYQLVCDFANIKGGTFKVLAFCLAYCQWFMLPSGPLRSGRSMQQLSGLQYRVNMVGRGHLSIDGKLI